MKVIFTLLLGMFYSSIIYSQTPCVGGMVGTYPCNNITLLSSLSRTQFTPPANSNGGTYNPNTDYGNDVWGWTDPASGREFVLSGRRNGTSFIEVTNPLQPIFIGYLFAAHSTWRDMKTFGNYAYIVSENAQSGIQIFDLHKLLNVANPPQIFSADSLVNINQSGANKGSAHNIVGNVESGYMYVVGAQNTPNGCSGGIEFFNVNDPLHPKYEGCVNGDGYTHDAICFMYQGPDLEHVGKEICIGSNTNKQTIVDVTNKGAWTTLSYLTYPNSRYTHQSWVSDDHRFVFFNDELDESQLGFKTRTHIMNIENLDQPQYLGFHQFTTPDIDHNCFVRGNYLYEANYGAGFRMLDLRNINTFPTDSLSEVAYLTTGAGARAWGVYPYFESGTIVLNTIEGNVFLLKPNIPHFYIETKNSTTDICVGEEVSFELDLISLYGYDNDVDLTVTGVPSGAVASFSSSTVNSDGSAVLTISNTQGLSGNHSMIVKARGSGDNTLQDISVSFRILPEQLTFSNQTFSNDKIIRASQQVTLQDINLAADKQLKIYSPSLLINNNLMLSTNSDFMWFNQDLCNEE